jgi:hypothetical protein
MRQFAKIVSLLSLGAVSIPCLLLLAGTLDLITVQWMAWVGTIGWFASTPAWMGRHA